MVLEFSDDFAFLGAVIIKEVVKELLAKGLDKAEVLLLAGSRSALRTHSFPVKFERGFLPPFLLLRPLPVPSAGGIGVLMNLDIVAELLQTLGHQAVEVRGLSDSGWILDRKRYKFGDCLDFQNCGPIDTVKHGIRWARAQKTPGQRSPGGMEGDTFFCCPDNGERSCRTSAGGLT